ncbi:IclR family transcriptional regulator [Arachnia propionica]|uniref:IclR family transcriptional regulator n=1 Tax=Arachnia propionica TaxID=1750 RepID=A0A3P1T8C7_9ACTN|nr:IclR family transcriptional regulator [Arachnia propionica]RRD04693.1 IclR family transcriptional regulator [Arachnia propionica]
MPKPAERERMQGAQSIDRALTLLSAFTAKDPQRRIADLVAETGLGQSTVSRMANALVQLGYLAHDARSGAYGLGPQVVTLAAVALNQNPLHLHARQIAQELAAETGLGVNVAQAHGSRLFYLCNFEGRDQPRDSTLIGRGGPLHATALGKVLLHEKDREELADLLGTRLERFTAATITTLDDLVVELGRIAEQGYATEREELALRRACIAVPVRDRSGTVAGAISISGPVSAMRLGEREQELSSLLIERADRICVRMGYLTHA